MRPCRRLKPLPAPSGGARCVSAAFSASSPRRVSLFGGGAGLQLRPRSLFRVSVGLSSGVFLTAPSPASASLLRVSLSVVARCFSAASPPSSASAAPPHPSFRVSGVCLRSECFRALRKRPCMPPSASPRAPSRRSLRGVSLFGVARCFSAAFPPRSAPVALPRVCWFVFGWFPLRAVPGLRVPSPRQPFCRCAVLPRRIPLSRPLPAPRPFLPWGGVSAPPSTPRPLAASIPLIALIPLIPSPLQASPLPLRAASVLAVVARCFSAAFLLRRSRQRRPRSPAMPLIPLKSSSPRMPPLPLRLWGLSSGGCLPAATQSPVCLKRGFPLCRSPRGVSLLGVVRCFSAAFSPRRRDAKTSQRPLSLTLARI